MFLILDSPSERYEHRLNKKINVDNNGVLNLRKLSEDSKVDETAKIKKLQHELDNIKTKYYSLKQDFELMSLNNNELKTTIYSLQEKNKTPQQIDQEKVIEELKDDNRNMTKKIEILINKINQLQEELMSAEKDLEKKKGKISQKDYKTMNVFNIQIEGI